MSSTLPSGWYPDPRGKADTYRWWAGESWTSWLSRDPESPDPTARRALPEPTPAESAQTESAPEPAPAETTGSEPPRAELPKGAERPQGYVPGYPLPQPRESKPKTSPSVYAVIGALGLVLALVGGTVVYRNAAATAAQEIPPPAPTASAKPGLAVELNQRTNTASIGTLETMLPGAPWICSPEPAPVKDWLSTSLECQVSVHKNYDGKGSSWVGTLGLGIAEEQYIVPGDAALTVEKLFTQRLNRFYGNQGLVIKNKKVTTLKGMPDSLSAVAIQADLDIDMAKLPTDYDRATMIAFELPDDAGFGVWYAERPNDAEAKAREQLQLALDSVRYS